MINELIDKFGYETVIKCKDLILFMSSFSLGVLVMLFQMGRVLKKIEKVNTLDNLSFVEIKDDSEKKHLYVNVSTIPHAIEVVIKLTILRYLNRKSYSVRSESRAKLLARIIVFILIVYSFIAIYLIFHPIII